MRPQRSLFVSRAVFVGAAKRPVGGGRRVVVGSGSGLSEEPASGCKAGHAGLRVVPPALPGSSELAARVGDQVTVDGGGDLAFECSERFFTALALVELAPVVGTSRGVVAYLGHRGDVQRPVQLPVAAGVEPVPLGGAAGRGDGGGAGVAGKWPLVGNRVMSPV